MGRKSNTFSLILAVAIIVVINLLADRYWLRVDLSEGQQYTLSSTTEEILGNLDKPVTVKAYFSDDLPPDFLMVKNQFKELLIEYAAESNGKVVFEFINPIEDPKIEAQIIGWGVQPVVIEVREKDQQKQMKAYIGAVVEMNEEREPIPFMQQGHAMEYALSSAIRKVAVLEKPRIGFIMGHGEPTLDEYSQTMAALSVQYEVVPYFIAGGTVPGPRDYTAMVWVRPTDSIPAAHFQFLDAYLANGGKLLVAYNPVEGDFVNFMGYDSRSFISNWLLTKGVKIEPNFVADQRCGSLTVQQNQGNFSYASNVPFPYLPMVQGVEGHPISQGLEAIMLEFPSAIEFIGDSSIVYQSIVNSSNRANINPAPIVIDVQRPWVDSDFPLSNISMGMSLLGNFGSEMPTKIVVFTDGDFIINGPRNSARQVQPDNINLFVNAIDWLSDDTGLVELRTRGVLARPLDQIEPKTRMFLKYLNFLLPIILVLIYGLIRARWRSVVRKRRMNENYN